ncbi:MAG: protein-L-isoaspartate O-methyltransferase [Dongiaceae bacterium]|jgi:protein-L-isoaspartate(D-aspartate) O-methyltransferase
MDGMLMKFVATRQRMVETQLRTNRVTDEAVLAALAEVPRELFVPRALRSVAYVDDDLEIERGRYLMEPMVFARLLQLAGIEPSDTVLDIGCGTGYSAVVIGRLAGSVVAVESSPTLAQRAEELFRELDAGNVSLVRGPLEQGHPAQAPYDVIFFDGAVAEIPAAIGDQLAEGGRLVCVTVESGVGRATLAVRSGGGLSDRPAFDAAIRLLPGFAPKPRFVF